MRILFAVLSFWMMGSIGLVIYSRIRQYRIDLKPDQSAYEGASSIPQVNYLSPANYSPAGRRLLRLFWVWHGLMFVTVVTDGWLIFSTF
jgi:hypothetical protein